MYGPTALLGGVDLEESRPLIASGDTVLDAADREQLASRTHERLAAPFAAVLAVDRVEVVIARGKSAGEQRSAFRSADVPPALNKSAVAW